MAAPTTDQIYQNLIAQIQASMNQRIPLLPKSFARVLAKAIAAVFTLLYKYGSFSLLQMFVRTATINDTEILGRTISPLREWGRTFGAGDPKPATAAELSLTVTVTDQTGQIPIGTQLIGTANGVLYLSTQAVPLDDATVLLPVVAATDASGASAAGAIGNLDVGAEVYFVSPISQVNRTTTVADTITQGVEAETVEAYRQRVTDYFQKRPQGGAYADYELWGETTPGVANIYPYRGAVPGTVDIYVEATDTEDGVPGPALLDAVKESIELDQDGLATRRPVGSYVIARPITRTLFTVDVLGLDVDNPGSVQANITQALEAYFLSREPYIPGVSVPPRNDRITASAVSGIVDDIVSSVGGVFGGVILKRVGITVGLYALAIGEKAKGEVTFV